MPLRVDTTPLKTSRPFRALFASRTITLDRRTIARAAEAGLAVFSALLALNAALNHPATWPLYAGAAAIMALTALQRPSLDAAVPRVVDRDRLAAASALMGLGGNAALIAGSALGGILAAGPGVEYA